MELTADIPGDQSCKDLLHQSPVAVYTCDGAGRILFYNQAAVTLWGRSPQKDKDLWCGSWKSYYPNGLPMPQDDHPMARIIKGSYIEKEEFLIERPDHSFRNLLAFPRPVFNTDNVITGAQNVLVDITDYKKGAEKEAILSAIVESSDDAIISKNLNGRITSWNQGAEKIFGYKESEVLGKPINILIPAHLQDEEVQIISNIKRGDKIDHFHTVRLTKDGREVQVSLTVSPVKDHNGNVVGASKIARDITEQRQREQELKQVAQRLEIVNSIGKLISEKLDVKTILQKVTDTTTKITGAAFGAFFYNTTDEQGESFTLYTLSGAEREDFEKFGMPRNTRVFDPTFKGEYILRSDDITKDPRYGHNPPHYGKPRGHLPVVSYLAVPVIATSGEVIGGLFFGHPEAGVFREEHEEIIKSISVHAAVALDNSRLFEEVKTISAKKDEFIALASHELKTPLTTIKVCLQILQKTGDEKAAKIFLEKSIKQVDKLNSLVSDLFDISKIESGKLQLHIEEFDLKQLLLDVIETFQYNKNTHHIHLEDDDDALIIPADRQRVEQAVTNLMANAIKYSPDADEVIIKLSRSGTEAIVSIKDKGIGLSKEEQKKIFARFYRAESPSNVSGLGLGLYLTKEIIDRHQGQIGVESTPGKGSTFYFTLPLIAPE